MKTLQKINTLPIAIAVVALLFIPFIAMRFTKEVNWTSLDFLIAGILMLSCFLAISAANRFVNNKLKKRLAIGLIMLSIVVIWVELAVGIF